MEEAVLSVSDFNIQKFVSNNQDKTEWKKSSPLKTYSKKTTPTSDGKSRYGRSHKPRLSGDFLSTDKKVSQYLKIDVDNQMHYFKASPYTFQKTPPVKNITPGTPRRGRPPKSLSLLKQDARFSHSLSEYSIKPNRPVTNLIDIEAPTSTETLPLPIQLVVPKDETFSDSEEQINDGDWNAGDLAWGCVGGFPYWPCAITKDPFELCFKRTKIVGKNKMAKECIHVQFFGDRGRRSWISSTHILPFHGLDSFQSLAEETCTAMVKKKDPKLYRSFTVLPSVRKAWQAAVSEAESLRESPRQERIMYFMNLYPPALPDPPREPKKRGRKRKSDSNETSLTIEKKIKLEHQDENMEQTADPILTDSPSCVKVNPEQEIPPNPILPSKKEIVTPIHESLRTFFKKEPITPVKEFIQKEHIPDVQEFPSIIKSVIEETNGAMETTPGDIKKAAEEVKSEVKSTAPSTGKKRGRPPGRKNKEVDDLDFTPQKKSYIKKSTNDAKLRENRTKKKSLNFDMKKLKKLRDPAFEIFYEKNFDRVSDENPELSEVDIDKFIEKMWTDVKDKQAGYKARSRDGAERCSIIDDYKSDSSSCSDSPPPLILPSVKTVFKRGISLFSGAKSEKVCQICFVGGEVLKCRGPCGLHFHANCAHEPRYQPTANVIIGVKKEVPNEIIESPPDIVKKRRGRPRKITLPPMPLNACSFEDEKNVIIKDEKNVIIKDEKNVIIKDEVIKSLVDNVEVNPTNSCNDTASDVRPSIDKTDKIELLDKNNISTVEIVANSCIAALEQEMKDKVEKENDEKTVDVYENKSVGIDKMAHNTDQNITTKSNSNVEQMQMESNDLESLDTNVLNSNDNPEMFENDKLADIPNKPALSDNLELALDLDDSLDTDVCEEIKGTDIPETNESIEEEVRNSEFTSKVDDDFLIIKSATNNCSESDVASLKEALSPDDKDFTLPEEDVRNQAYEIENTRKDNLKLLGTLRGDSFESDNMLVVDDSSTDDRLMIVESSSSDENNRAPEPLPDSTIDNKLEVISSKLQNSKDNGESSNGLLLNVPMIDFADITENDQNDPMIFSKNNQDMDMPTNINDTLYTNQADTNVIDNSSQEMEVDTPPAPSSINGSEFKVDVLEDKINSLQEDKDSISEEIPQKKSKLSKKEEKEAVKRLSKSGKMPKGGSIKDDGENSSKSSDTDSDKIKNKGWMCNLCTEGIFGPCFICGKDDGDRLRCGYCGKVYHLKCAKEWPQSQFSEKAKGRLVLHCPQHVCHTCNSDNPSSLCARYTNDRLVRCVKCPSTYHNGNYCIPAGSEILSMSQIICPRHYIPVKKGLHHVNASWCFICAIASPIAGGALICCDLCPNSFHAECLKINPPDGAFVCEDCETGRYPLYGEIVWVKLGTYRWWPAKILYPQEVPENINQLAHTCGEFAVEFFGTHDYYWVNRGRVFLYHEGDGCKIVSKSRVDELFTRGVQEASEAFVKWSVERANREASSRPSMKPPKYIKILSNRFCGNAKNNLDSENNATTCDCDPTKPNPCGSDSDCINRLLMVECDPQVCPARDNCCNQNFEKKSYPSLVPYRTENRGWGLKTLDPIPKGGFIIEYVGEMIDEEEYRKRLAVMQQNKDENFYFLTIDKDRMLDAGPKGNVARFMNHSCNPNCETQKWTVNGDTRVGLFSLEDIKPETELVFNYNLETIGNTKVECKCGAPNCAGYIGAKNLSKHNSNKHKNGEEKKAPVKKKKRKSAKINQKHTEDTCFTCGNGGELLLCDDASCPKAYHLSCLGLTKHPAGGWVCPWHQCSVCSATKVQRCTLCINSYCSEHAEGNISLNRNRGLLCYSHNLSDSGSDWSAVSEDEESSKIKSVTRKYSRSKIVNGHTD